MIVGVDEAGRGPLAGVVVGCALYLHKNPPFTVRDSKELSAARRREIFEWLKGNAVFSVQIARSCEIDRINILNASFLAFNRAIAGILARAPYLKTAEFIIDGNMFRTGLKVKYSCVVRADKTVREVSCASIMAKVTRDHLMDLADFTYPQWNFSKHKGYPTREHFLLIDKYGPSPLHRRSFRIKK